MCSCDGARYCQFYTNKIALRQNSQSSEFNSQDLFINVYAEQHPRDDIDKRNTLLLELRINELF